MNVSFILKHYGHLSLEEQDRMSAEERKWWMRRLKQEFEPKSNSNQPPPQKT